MTRRIRFGLFFCCIFIAYAALMATDAKAGVPTTVVETLPYSNDTAGVVAISTAFNPTSITVSSMVAPTRLDTLLNAALLSALGANYTRGSVVVQNYTSTNAYVGFSASGWTAGTGGYVVGPGNPVMVFHLGKNVGLWAWAEPAVIGATTTLRVGGYGWK